MKACLVYQPGFYEEGTILGIFATFKDAREWVESQNPDKHFSLAGIEIQEWNGAELIKTYDRKLASPMQWDEHDWRK